MPTRIKPSNLWALGFTKKLQKHFCGRGNVKKKCNVGIYSIEVITIYYKTAKNTLGQWLFKMP